VDSRCAKTARQQAPPPVLLTIAGLADSVDTWNDFAQHLLLLELICGDNGVPIHDAKFFFFFPTESKWGYTAKEATTALVGSQ